jgi:hypothetical protein
MATQPDEELELTPDMEVDDDQDQDDQGGSADDDGEVAKTANKTRPPA